MKDDSTVGGRAALVEAYKRARAACASAMSAEHAAGAEHVAAKSSESDAALHRAIGVANAARAEMYRTREALQAWDREHAAAVPRSPLVSVSHDEFERLPRLSHAEIQAALGKGRAEAFPGHHPLAAAVPSQPLGLDAASMDAAWARALDLIRADGLDPEAVIAAAAETVKAWKMGPPADLIGCGDHSCDVARPKGQGTNAGCRCDEHTLRRAVRRLRAEVGKLDTLWRALIVERDSEAERADAAEAALSAADVTIAALRADAERWKAACEKCEGAMFVADRDEDKRVAEARAAGAKAERDAWTEVTGADTAQALAAELDIARAKRRAT